MGIHRAPFGYRGSTHVGGFRLQTWGEPYLVLKKGGVGKIGCPRGPPNYKKKNMQSMEEQGTYRITCDPHSLD